MGTSRDRPPARRLTALFAALAVAFAAVGFRLVVLQLRNAGAYESLAREQRLRHIQLPAARGSIFDRDGNELAISLPAKAVYTNPRLVRDVRGTARALAPLLETSVRRLEGALGSEEPFVYLARRVDLGVARKIERLALAGVATLDESKRYYPGGDLASHVLGFVGVDNVGLAGVELQYDELLSGRPGEIVVEQDPQGRSIPQGEQREVPSVPGAGLVLTIDRDLQYAAQQAVARAVRANGAKGGMVVVLDASTSQILAMVTHPSFDANGYSHTPAEVTRNRTLTDAYEPGSVNKVITAAAALEEGVIGVRDVLEVPDSYQMADKLFHDSHSHPVEPMTIGDVIAQSSNIGSMLIAERLGKHRLARYLGRFGFGHRTGVGFPGESDGILLPEDRWSGTSMGTITIGQGIAVTPLQMASVYATIANGGAWVQPRLVRGIVDGRGTFHPAAPPEFRRVVSKWTARQVTRLLAYAVESGTGTQAQIPGYWVAGKTGTARKPLEGQLGYSDRHVASFIGFAPASDPGVVVAAIIDEPVTVYGGIAAAPLFREVARFALAQRRVPAADPPRRPPSALPS